MKAGIRNKTVKSWEKGSKCFQWPKNCCCEYTSFFLFWCQNSNSNFCLALANTACDPVIEEHFRRSLGKNYKEPEPTATNTVSITGSVDDHFAKALGETWLQIKNKGSPSSTSSSPNSSPDSRMVNHNHSPSLVSWRGAGLFPQFPQHTHHHTRSIILSASSGLLWHQRERRPAGLLDAAPNPSTCSLAVDSPTISQAIKTRLPGLNRTIIFRLPVTHHPCMWSSKLTRSL